jgi:hypothetical protein
MNQSAKRAGAALVAPSSREREEIEDGWRADSVQAQLRKLRDELGATCAVP